MDDGLVALGLASDTGAHARERVTPLLRNRLAAIIAFLGAFPLGRYRPSAEDRVLHCVVDLVLNVEGNGVDGENGLETEQRRKRSSTEL